MMFITPKHSHRPETVHALTLMSAGCGGAALCRLATRSSNGSMQFARTGVLLPSHYDGGLFD